MNDASIAALYRDRSEAAIRETEKKYGEVCLRLANNILHNECDAQECVNDAYLALWESLADREPPRYFKAYLLRIVRYIAYDMLKKRTAQKRGEARPMPLEELAEILPDPRTPEQELDAAALTEALEVFLLGLPQRHRYIFLRRYFYCDGVSEIAAALGAPESTVSVTLNRVKKKLKAYLEKEGFSV
ncbi:MAG: sigma-70 family RNA polymerase sigma factor [Clostridia bacterium]|nr:sigma-70 family RNA polymerase sigma factor [Clostridia bacterium]